MGRDGGVPFQAFLEWQENGGRGGQGCAFGGPPLTIGVSDGVLGYVPVRVLSAHTVITLRGRYYYFHFPAPKQKDREVTLLVRGRDRIPKQDWIQGPSSFLIPTVALQGPAS